MSYDEPRGAAAADGAMTTSRGLAPASAVASSLLPSVTLSPAFSAAC
jgi:hypothetical protein